MIVHLSVLFCAFWFICLIVKLQGLLLSLCGIPFFFGQWFAQIEVGSPILLFIRRNFWQKEAFIPGSCNYYSVFGNEKLILIALRIHFDY